MHREHVVDGVLQQEPQRAQRGAARRRQPRARRRSARRQRAPVTGRQEVPADMKYSQGTSNCRKVNWLQFLPAERRPY